MNDPDINYLIKDMSTLAKLRYGLPKNLYNFDTMFKIMEKAFRVNVVLLFYLFSMERISIQSENISTN